MKTNYWKLRMKLISERYSRLLKKNIEIFQLNSIIDYLRTKNAQLEQENNRLHKNNNEENDEVSIIHFFHRI